VRDERHRENFLSLVHLGGIISLLGTSCGGTSNLLMGGKTMDWEAAAEEQLSQSLKEVPIMFRAMAKNAIRSGAENTARQRGATAIAPEDVIRGHIVTTPGSQKSGLRKTMEKLSIDTGPYEDLLP
jgi:hypothetical protein